jgi:hypothetical protein
MAARGMGATYTQLSTGQPLRILGETERCRLAETITIHTMRDWRTRSQMR